MQKSTLTALIEQRRQRFLQAQQQARAVQADHDAAAALHAQLRDLAPRSVTPGEQINAASLRAGVRFNARVQTALLAARARCAEQAEQLDLARDQAREQACAMQALECLARRREAREQAAALKADQACSDEHAVLKHAR